MNNSNTKVVKNKESKQAFKPVFLDNFAPHGYGARSVASSVSPTHSEGSSAERTASPSIPCYR